MEPITSAVAVPNRGVVHQTTAAAANQTDVAASTSTAVAVPGDVGTRSSTAVAASEGNVAALETTTKMVCTSSGSANVPDDPKAHLMFYLRCLSSVLKAFFGICKEILELDD
jgi:O-acetylhomoserine/O-acetylserine sulfhydrylase-like pyridoxal-dependent enzyme